MKSKLHLFVTVPILLHFTLILTPITHGEIRQPGMNAEKTAKYKAASPLNHNVRIQRTGRVLKLDYELLGTDGKKYDLWDIHDRSKPTFVVYKDNVNVGGGTFEFG